MMARAADDELENVSVVCLCSDAAAAGRDSAELCICEKLLIDIYDI